jgi:hypothetical protein
MADHVRLRILADDDDLVDLPAEMARLRARGLALLAQGLGA